jgi:uroporphyrin-III C-methyltransferase/precorrin-2 dehydrogenase/sirohydrochlorin ferrochelatase
VRYYLLFIDLAEKPVLFSGAGWHAAAKIRLWLKTEARMEVYGDPACDDVLDWAQDGRLVHVSRCLTGGSARQRALRRA